MNFRVFKMTSVIAMSVAVLGCQSEQSTANTQAVSKLQQNEVKPANDFALAAFKQLQTAKSGESFVFSPVSLRLTLAMIASGAKAESRKELVDAVKLESDLAKQATADGRLTSTLSNQDGVDLFNLAILTPEFKPNADYSSRLKSNYECEITTKNDVKSINDLVKTKSNGAFSSIVDALPANLRMILVNGIRYKSSWKSTFDQKQTHKRTFTNGDQTSEIDMMSQKMTLSWFEDEQLTAAQLEMTNGCSMIVVMPSQGSSLTQCAEKVDQKLITKLINASASKVRLVLPKWETKTRKNLIAELQQLKVKRVFGDGAQLGGMSSSEDLYVSEIVQQASIEVNEEGAEAKAVTHAMVKARSMAPSIVFDRPFLYLIVRDSDQLILFSGQFCGKS